MLRAKVPCGAQSSKVKGSMCCKLKFYVDRSALKLRVPCAAGEGKAKGEKDGKTCARGRRKHQQKKTIEALKFEGASAAVEFEGKLKL